MQDLNTRLANAKFTFEANYEQARAELAEAQKELDYAETHKTTDEAKFIARQAVAKANAAVDRWGHHYDAASEGYAYQGRADRMDYAFMQQHGELYRQAMEANRMRFEPEEPMKLAGPVPIDLPDAKPDLAVGENLGPTEYTWATIRKPGWQQSRPQLAEAIANGTAVLVSGGGE